MTLAPQAVPDDPAVWLPTRIQDTYCLTCQQRVLIPPSGRCHWCGNLVGDA